MIPASDEAGVPQQGGIFVKAIASRREDSRYSSDTAQSRGQCGERDLGARLLRILLPKRQLPK
jgi:hypothetical protein